MRKLYTMAAALLMASASFAQVNVTYKVDITDYLAAGNTLGANGIRIGGNFTTNGATNPDWTPSDAANAMTQEGATNVWAITIAYPAASIGLTQQYKFVNNDWGTNEGTDAANTIGADGCGTDDGAGNVNRTLVVPATDITLQFCWDRCLQCDGSPAGFELVGSTVNFSVFPNPTADVANVEFNVATPSEVSIEVYNALGQRVAVNNLGNVLPGSYKQTLNMETAVAGIYFVKMNVGGKSSTSRLSIAK
jgi:hypothetical protein